MTCEWCGGPVTLQDAQTSSGRETWHTRCWNQAAQQRRQYLKEMDDAEGFSLHNAPPDRSVRPFLTSGGRNQNGRR